ncbi:M99 family carboxypeptidase catalytic domain-containing protein [Sulfurimonas sp.]|uniref:M99 family carboxypeptidase catalytic domain-containing protein n=1 Tax=Sulfurimonas sp. TaxID=2022749 RepID=UPI003564C512
MLKLFFLLTLSFSLALSDIQLLKKQNNDSNTTLLVIGGIHGDEPGGYFAASLLATNYEITSGNLWIVPNLNKKSIQKDVRGINGDMNRKFSIINQDDKDAAIIKEIKNIILSKDVSLVLNLHDGHGFYRKEDQGRIFNPNSWGQTCVIDQCQLSQDQPFGNLNDIALTIKNSMNKKLIQSHHSFDVRNTKTKFEDEAMQLSLTYFAVTNNKPAFAIETSKNLSSLAQKVFYQLLAIEEFMKIMDIKYQRNFELTVQNVEKTLKEYGNLIINDNISFNLNNIKKYLSYIPLKSKHNVFDFSHPLGSFIKVDDRYIVLIGNKKVTTLKAQYFEKEQKCPEYFKISVDGNVKKIKKTSEFYVTDDFKVLQNNSVRVNVIGYKSKNPKTEAGIDIAYSSIEKRFSIDNDGKIFRIEHYKNNKFCSMNMVHFK